MVLVMVILFVWSPWYALSFGLLIAGGIGQAGFGTMQSAITMLEAPREMRGRMMGLLSVCIGVGTPLGTLEIGAMAVLFSTQWALSVNAFVGVILPHSGGLFYPAGVATVSGDCARTGGLIATSPMTCRGPVSSRLAHRVYRLSLRTGRRV